MFLPQFIPDGANVAAASLVLASVQAAEAVIWYVGLAYVAARAARVLNSDRARRWLDRLAGTVFLAFAGRLAADGGHS